MTAGFQTFNNGYVLQIDQDYKNYYFAQLLTIAITQGPLFGGGPADQGCRYQDVDIAGGLDNLIGFYQNGGIGACFEVLSSNGATTRYRFFRQGQGVGNINVVIFRPTPGDSAGNVGRQVFRADGSLAYDSNRPYLRVLDLFGYSVASGNAETRNYPGYNAAIIQCARGWSQDQLPAGGGAIPSAWVFTSRGDFYYASGTQVTIQDRLMYVESHPGGETPPYSAVYNSIGSALAMVVNMNNFA